MEHGRKLGVAEIPRQERRDVIAVFGGRQVQEDVLQIRTFVEPVGARRGDQAVEAGAGRCTVLSGTEQPGFSAHRKRPDPVFDQVVVEG